MKYGRIFSCYEIKTAFALSSRRLSERFETINVITSLVLKILGETQPKLGHFALFIFLLLYL